MSTTKPKNPPAKGGLSLYANLLDPSSSTNNTDGSTISRAPVVFQQPGDSSATSAQDDAAAAAKKQISAAALRFQPARRPQVAAQKAKTKAAGFARAVPAATTGGGGKAAGAATGGNIGSAEAAATATVNNTNGDAGPNAIHQPQPPAAKATLADWTATNNEEDDNINGFYQGEKRQRGGRKKRKKGNKGGEVMQIVQDWDDIYDPTRPNSYEEYSNSDEKRREIREWKEKLYAHRRARRRDSVSSSSEREDREPPVRAFAPPANYSFAPPPIGETTENASKADLEPPPPADISNDTTGEDAYLRRLQLSNAAPQQTGLEEAQEPPLPPSPPSQAEPMSTSATATASSLQIPSQPPPPPSIPLSSTSSQHEPPQQESFPPVPPTTSTTVTATPTATISRAPVRYNLPTAPAEIEVSQADLDASLARDMSNNDNYNSSGTAEAKNAKDNQQEQQTQESAPAPRSNRPGQVGFAERYMASQGWKRGEGLGASGSGIINPLRVQVEKRKQRSDADGGGFVGPGGKGKIVGGGKRKKMTTTEAGTEVEEKEEHGKFGPMSEVVVARGMLVSMDVDAEIANGLLQELGEECEAKYGRLVRVFINRESTDDSPPVFFHFTTALSALRAVNALHGRIFNGNTITAKFFDAEKFEKDSFE